MNEVTLNPAELREDAEFFYRQRAEVYTPAVQRFAEQVLNEPEGLPLGSQAHDCQLTRIGIQLHLDGEDELFWCQSFLEAVAALHDGLAVVAEDGEAVDRANATELECGWDPYPRSPSPGPAAPSPADRGELA